VHRWRLHLKSPRRAIARRVRTPFRWNLAGPTMDRRDPAGPSPDREPAMRERVARISRPCPSGATPRSPRGAGRSRVRCSPMSGSPALLVIPGTGLQGSQARIHQKHGRAQCQDRIWAGLSYNSVSPQSTVSSPSSPLAGTATVSPFAFQPSSPSLFLPAGTRADPSLPCGHPASRSARNRPTLRAGGTAQPPPYTPRGVRYPSAWCGRSSL
jgi:hypothetical protein